MSSQLAVFEVTGVQYITVVDLDVSDFEVGQAIDHDIACVVFLSAGFRIEACSIENDPEISFVWDFTC